MSYFIPTETPAGGKLSLKPGYYVPRVEQTITIRLIDGVFQYRIGAQEVGIGGLPRPIIKFLGIALQSDRVIELVFQADNISVGLDDRSWWKRLLRDRLQAAADELYEELLAAAAV